MRGGGEGLGERHTEAERQGEMDLERDTLGGETERDQFLEADKEGGHAGGLGLEAEIDKGASSGQAPGGRRALISQGPFSLSTLRGKKSHLALGSWVWGRDGDS